ncbi:MAG: cache domain-containing protein [Candidatus Omnitrophica bacterium]|nr:cache domain-containing protein [Candidatus Omnitrophota bacterium]MDD5737248.1 cache domain-containing protein [Candidatus Omnitrophota bacterium]
MNRIKASAVLLAAAVLCGFLSAGAYGAGKDDPLSVILTLQGKINSSFAKMDAEVAAAAKELSKTGIEGAEARKIMRKLAKSSRYCVDCSTVDMKGNMVIIEPEEYRKYEGANIIGQAQAGLLHRARRPVFGDVFMSVEGFYAAAIQHPVFSERGEMIGSVSLMFRPDYFFKSLVEPEVKGLPVHVWVMQKDGRDIYDDDPKQIGKNVLQDPMYKPFPALVDFAKKISAEQTGSGSYDFFDIGTKEVIRKDSVWTTVGLYGAQWRLVVARKEELPSGNAKQDASIKSATQAAASMLQGIYDKHKKGEFTLEQAKKLGADLLRQMRYGDDGKEYFWADTVDGLNIVHAIDTGIEGKNRYDANINGVYYIRGLIASGKKPGGGYTVYWFHKPGGKDPEKKRSFSLLFKPFGWVIGTGYYLE